MSTPNNYVIPLIGSALIITGLFRAEAGVDVDPQTFRLAWWGLLAGAVVVQGLCLYGIFKRKAG